MSDYKLNEHFFPTLQENALLGDLSSKTFPGEQLPLDPPRGSGLWPPVLQGSCLLTSQCPSTPKVNENPALLGRKWFLVLNSLRAGWGAVTESW